MKYTMRHAKPQVNTTARKWLSLLLVAALLVQIWLLPEFAFAIDRTNQITQVVQDGFSIDADKAVEDLDNGIFKLNFTADAHVKTQVLNNSATAARNGVFVVPQSGYYLMELWGGAGHDGYHTTQSDGGVGGASGYVYGYRWLEEGQTLVYHIGSNGQTAMRSDMGGGANGDGGDHGETGIFEVGCGGGFSALYLFDDARTTSTVTEQEKMTNYIMIAGGGGGGGTGNQWLINATGTADGGRGGHVTISQSGHLTAEDNSGVAGTFFRGSNGRSSGTSTSYIGRGGGSVPGRGVSTSGGEYTSQDGNDWSGTFNTLYDYGAGGDSDLRGGGGGAGFCGGSGGIMVGVAFASDIGGGGGGSSFIADSVSWRNLPAAYSAYLQRVNGSRVGGSFVVTYLGETEGEIEDDNHLGNVTLTGSISTYFDIVSISTHGNGTATYNSSNAITVTGADIRPASSGFAGNQLDVEIMVRPRSGFAGGNNVPLIGNAFRVTPAGKESVLLAEYAPTDYVNVPLDFEAIAKSYMSSDISKSYAVTSLYTDKYASVRDNLSAYWQYDFISSIGSYTVQAEGATANLSGSVSPTVTTRYTVGFTVYPKTTEGYASLGARVASTKFTDTATIAIVQANEATLNDTIVRGNKQITFNGTDHVFGIVASFETAKFDIPAKVSGTSSGSFVVEKSGWYYMQAWGGNGGASGSASATGINGNTTRTTSGGTGGKGGYVSGYIWLEKDQVVTYVTGASRTSTSNVGVKSNSYWSGKGGTSSSGGYAGNYTYIQVDGEYVMVAGGGGGAGGSAIGYSQTLGILTFSQSVGSTGNSASTTSYSATFDSTMNSYAGGRGGTGSGSSGSSSRAGSAGSAGSNYKNESVFATSGFSASAKNYAQSLTTTKTTNTSGAAGQVTVTCLETAEAQAAAAKMSEEVTFSGTFSRYFNVAQVTADNSNAPNMTMSYSLTDNADGTTRYNVTNVTFTPVMVQTAANDTRQLYYRAAPVINFRLTRKDGFIGGNDVPVLVYDVTEPGATDPDGNPDCGVKITLKEDYMWLPASDFTDFANVPINYTFLDENFATQDTTITCGESYHQWDLITVNNIPMPTGADAWKAEFVQPVYQTTQPVSPTQTTTYTFKQEVAPKAAAQKAQVAPSVSAVSFAKPATIYVQYSVTDNMVHLDYEGDAYLLDGNDLSVTVQPETGYLLPTSIGVTVGGSTLSASRYSYNAETGALFIDEQYITGNIVLTGTARLQTYKLTYLYEQEDGTIGEYSEEYVSGAAIDLTWYNNFNANVPARAGHEYTWQWETDDGQPLTAMPAQDWFAIGSYTPLAYTLTVNYYKVGTTDSVADSYTKVMAYGSEYSVLSPEVAGYAPDLSSVTGTLAADTTLNVYYTPNDGMLTVFFIYTDSNTEVCDRFVKTDLPVGESWTVTLPMVDGYTPSPDTLTVTMPVTGGITEYVYYSPLTYTVTFDANGGELATGEDSKTVLFHNIYGYDPATASYGELPQPLRTGYEFTGWVDQNGTPVKEETVVNVVADHTLTATWKAYTFKLTVHYQYADGTTAQPTVTQSHEYGASFEVITPEIVGYTPDIAVVSGNMGGGNRVVFVTYTINIYTITVHYIGPEGDPLAADYVTEQEYNSTYAITSPVIAGYTADTLTVEGTVGPADVEVTVYYGYIEYSLTVNYVIADGPGIQPAPYVEEGLHINSTYAVIPPVVEGYTPSIELVEGTFGAGDVIQTVTYTRNSYTLTVEYLYGEDILDAALIGTTASPTVTRTVLYGDAYSVASPVVANYAFDIATVTGTMPAADVTVTVYYNQVVSVTVTWGDLSFSYKDAVWHPETHTYSIPPEVAGSNTVTVQNDDASTAPVSATATYTPSVPTLNAYFTDTDNVADTPITSPETTLSVGESVTVWLWLEGYMTNEYLLTADEDGYITTGVCTVTIGGDNG